MPPAVQNSREIEVQKFPIPRSNRLESGRPMRGHANGRRAGWLDGWMFHIRPSSCSAELNIRAADVPIVDLTIDIVNGLSEWGMIVS